MSKMTEQNDFNEKLERLQQDHLAEFSVTASLDELTELFELVKKNNIDWFDGSPIDSMFELIHNKMLTYPDKIFVLSFQNGFDLNKRMTIFCTWDLIAEVEDTQ